jgi:hypothetical protein
LPCHNIALGNDLQQFLACLGTEYRKFPFAGGTFGQLAGLILCNLALNPQFGAIGCI